MLRAVGSRWNRKALKDRPNFHRPDDEEEHSNLNYSISKSKTSW